MQRPMVDLLILQLNLIQQLLHVCALGQVARDKAQALHATHASVEIWRKTTLDLLVIAIY